MVQVPLTENLLFKMSDCFIIKVHPGSRCTNYQVRNNDLQIDFMAEDKVIARQHDHFWCFHDQKYRQFSPSSQLLRILKDEKYAGGPWQIRIMTDTNYRLIISSRKDLAVVKLDSKGKLFDSEQFEIETPIEEGYDHKTLLSNDGQIYRLYNLGKKEEEQEEEK